MNVERVSFNQVKAYWLEVDHFVEPNKKIREVVRRLGPYESAFTDPRRQSYGLFDEGKLVGATHLVQWSDELVRYRTLNVRASHRGRGLGAYLLRSAIELDWQDCAGAGMKLFGWIRRDHQPWALAHEFSPLDGAWYDDHMAMVRPLAGF